MLVTELVSSNKEKQRTYWHSMQRWNNALFTLHGRRPISITRAGLLSLVLPHNHCQPPRIVIAASYYCCKQNTIGINSNCCGAWMLPMATVLSMTGYVIYWLSSISEYNGRVQKNWYFEPDEQYHLRMIAVCRWCTVWCANVANRTWSLWRQTTRPTDFNGNGLNCRHIHSNDRKALHQCETDPTHNSGW